MYSSESMEGREACGETAGSQEGTRDNGEEEEEEEEEGGEEMRVETGDRLRQTGPRGMFVQRISPLAGMLTFCPCTTQHNVNEG